MVLQSRLTTPQAKRLRAFLNHSQPVTDLLGLVLITGFFLRFIPAAVFNPTPATGGDLGSHFWPLAVLRKYGIEHLSLRVWNPGNLCGEALLLNYFPLPFLFMAFLGYAIPIGTAFNLGTLLPLGVLPIAIYFCLRGLNHRFPIPILGAGLSTLFIYNESYSMWGGNFLSTLAGEFTHVYALCFLFFSVGTLAWEIRKNRFPLVSAILFACIPASHAYIAISLPSFFLSILFFYPKSTFRNRLVKCLWSGGFALFLSLWQIIPMSANRPWTTPSPEIWASGKLLQESVPAIFYPVAVILLAGFLLDFMLKFKRSHARTLRARSAFFWAIPFFEYIGLYFLLPKVGLVDVRALPQTQLFACILAAIFLGSFLSSLGRPLAWLLSIPFLLLTLGWTNLFILNLPGWVKWNYSGWETKPLYGNLVKLSDAVRGNFSEPRIVYEQSDLSNGAGTERVFEMLPYFAGRATCESLYMQANILAPMIYRQQAEISKTASCPFRNYDCPKYNLARAIPKLRLMGVSQLILTSDPLLSEANASPLLKPEGVFGPWHLFKFKTPPSLAEVFMKKPWIAEDPGWKDIFYTWFKIHRQGQRMILLKSTIPSSLLHALEGGKRIKPDPWSGSPDCKPEVQVNFNEIILKTPCPGRAHFLKFAYSPFWETDTGDPLFAASPGFLALIPSKTKVHLRFGQGLIFKVADTLSLISLLLLFFLAWRHRRTI